MKQRYHLAILAALAACALGLAGCEATIHQYPAEEQAMEDFVVRLHADRTPPPFYKEIAYDPDGRRTETELEAEASPAYLPDDRLALRFVVEVRDNGLGGDEAVVARRELTVDNDALPPQAEVHFRLPAGGDYTAVAGRLHRRGVGRLRACGQSCRLALRHLAAGLYRSQYGDRHAGTAP